MTLRTRLLRILIGLVVLAVALVAGFAIFQAQMPHWGATPAEAALALPGDETLSAPVIDWTNARTINAPPEKVWPWLAQIGDTRGAFYSFTFIEDRVGALTGGADYTVNYTNANEIHPEWQNPQARRADHPGPAEVGPVRAGEVAAGDLDQPGRDGLDVVVADRADCGREGHPAGQPDRHPADDRR